MEPVKTCATCRHSTVGRRDPMDWWKLRLCAHPGLVDRVEGRPLYSCVDARGREGACSGAGTLWEAVPTASDDEWVKMNEMDSARMQRIFAGAFEPDPVDEAEQFTHTEVRKTFTVPASLLPRKPARKRKPRAPREAIE